MGNVTFPAAGTYVLLFRCTGTNELSASPFYQVPLKCLTMTPVAAEEEEETFEEKIENATSGTITLEKDETVGAIVMNPNVTLNLNGHKLTATSVNAAATGAKVIDSFGGGVLIVAEKGFSGNGNNGGYLPLYNGTGYSFYQTAVNVNSAADGKLKFQVKFDKNAGFDALSAANTGVDIGGYFDWTPVGGQAKQQSWGITYENATLAQTWGQMVKEKNYANGWIVLNFAGLDQFAALSVEPYIESDTGVRIQAAAQTLK